MAEINPILSVTTLNEWIKHFSWKAEIDTMDFQNWPHFRDVHQIESKKMDKTYHIRSSQKIQRASILIPDKVASETIDFKTNIVTNKETPNI